VTPNDSPLLRARELATALSPAANAVGIDRLDLAVSVGAALALSKAALPEEASPLLRATHAVLDVGFSPARNEAEAFAAIDALAGHERSSFLESAGSFVAPRLALALADVLEREHLLPNDTRLAALLVGLDGPRCERLLTRWQSAGDRRQADEAVALALATNLDSGVPLLPAVLRAWQALEGRPRAQADEAWFSARLLVEARRDAVAALPLLNEAIEEYGASSVEPGLTSVIARIARRDPALLEPLLESEAWAADRALCLSAAAFDGVLRSSDEGRVRDVLEAVRSSPKAQNRHPRPVLDVSLSLLELAATTGRADLAEEIIEATGPAAWIASLVTRRPARRRALREGRADREFGLRLRAALQRVGPGVAAAVVLPDTSLEHVDDDTRARWWELETLPILELPWWNSWGVEPP
jgi:hypothetical protein